LIILRDLKHLPRDIIVTGQGSFIEDKELFRLRNSKPELRIEPNVVVPGQPIRGIQLTFRKSHDFREARIHAVDPVDHTLGSNDGNIAYDLYRSKRGCSEGAAPFAIIDLYPMIVWRD
jgi:hypothetical protein